MIFERLRHPPITINLVRTLKMRWGLGLLLAPELRLGNW